MNVLLVSYMQDKKGNKIQIGDRVKVLWAVDKREYEGKVINIKENIALLSAKDFFVYINRPERLLKIAGQ